ncbi:DNA-binding protein [Aurantimonas sp. C2-5-R2]|uniref:DNA-binding protein n=1 Tax=Aurantimonas sp. C2-5-R2 TaxID=3113713 RepID=UPI002F923467
MSVPAYLKLDEVVERYRNQISAATLRNWRSKRIGPSFIKIGKAVLYPVNELGSGLIDQSQKMTAAAMQMAEKKVWAQRS